MNPVIMESSLSIAAGATSNNVLASLPSQLRYLRAPFLAAGKILLIQSAAGLVVDFDVGSKNLVANSHPAVATAMEEPNHVVNDMWFVNEGDTLTLRVSNPTAGALTIRYRIVLMPAAERGIDCRVMQQGPISVAAAAVDVQLLDGTRYERPPLDCIADYFMSASAVGLLRAVDIGIENVSPPSAVSATNRVPLDPFDNVIGGVEVPKDTQQLLSVSNPTGGALNIFWRQRLYETAVT